PSPEPSSPRATMVVVTPLVRITLIAWAVFEVIVRVREVAQHKGGRARDRFTRGWIVLALGVTIGGALGAQAHVPSLDTTTRIVGLPVMWLGLALRIWAVVALGSSFRTTVEVDPGQAVVTRGPYRWVRHPSYTGLLLILAGFGLALCNWLSLAIC